MNTSEMETLQILMPERLIEVTIEYRNGEVAQRLFELLNSPTTSRGFTNKSIFEKAVTVTCKSWAAVKVLEDLARAAKMDVYDKKV